ncbi:MBL fold metallo-hydrolase, partial [Actinomadura sp. HBU206391]|uniref:MBL fold metallo-hydrolase n=1 Tax=Actinomadura sp. HBU206391 TaxID=2731692 RepID=UPI00165044DB
IEALRATTDKPVVALVNTHFHGDHTLGNSAVPTSRIIAHRSAYERLATGGGAYRELLCGVRPDLAPEIADLEFQLPTELVDDELVLDLGDVSVDIRHTGGHAHTTGDLVVLLPSHGIYVASDLLFNGILPVARDADLAGWTAVLAEQRDSFTGEIVVPGHGAVGGRGLFDRQIEVLSTVVAAVTDTQSTGGSLGDARAAALAAVGTLLHADERIDAYVNQIWTKEKNRSW